MKKEHFEHMKPKARDASTCPAEDVANPAGLRV